MRFKIIGKKKKANVEGILFSKNIKWTFPKKKNPKQFIDWRYNFRKKNNKNWVLKQYPKVNGGILVLDPFTGDVLALVGGFNFKTSEFNRVTQAKSTAWICV